MNLDAKEKAEQLFYKFFLIKDEVYDECRMHENEAKQCALIAVDEMIKILPYGYSETRFYLDELEKEIRSYEM